MYKCFALGKIGKIQKRKKMKNIVEISNVGEVIQKLWQRYDKLGWIFQVKWYNRKNAHRITLVPLDKLPFRWSFS